ncbi:hypothetical protein [Microcoleus sp.]|uniref:hypothetical protein n=1 Tax=Microcoleus sp. TaxID=44472 RepID=UPI00352534AB
MAKDGGVRSPFTEIAFLILIYIVLTNLKSCVKEFHILQLIVLRSNLGILDTGAW